MIRRDYIIEMIEQFARALASIRELRRDQRSQDARTAADSELQKLAGIGATGVAKLSDTELRAILVKDQPTQALHDRLFMVVALLNEAAETAVVENRIEEASTIRLKALDVLLGVSAEEVPDGHPAFVPRVEELVLALAGEALPVQTRAMLMRHYHTTGQWDKAEDALFALLDSTGNDPEAIKLGRLFYENILGLTDSTLSDGGLPRAEAEQGLAELENRAAALTE
jgi:hypothetical protein